APDRTLVSGHGERIPPGDRSDSRHERTVPTQRGEGRSRMSEPRIVVGVVRGQADRVLNPAAPFAQELGAELICRHVGVPRYATGFLPSGFMVSMPIDPELPDDGAEGMPPELEEHLTEVLTEAGIAWSTRAVAGDPALALGQVAEDLDARAIVVGTR